MGQLESLMEVELKAQELKLESGLEMEEKERAAEFTMEGAGQQLVASDEQGLTAIVMKRKVRVLQEKYNRSGASLGVAPGLPLLEQHRTIAILHYDYRQRAQKRNMKVNRIRIKVGK